MTFLNILQDPLTNLPIEQPDGQSFKQTITSRIAEFGALIDSLDKPVKDAQGKNVDLNEFKTLNKILREGIIDTIKTYYTGDLHAAFDCLDTFMMGANANGYLNKQSYAEPGSNFFRIRKCNGNFPLTRPELFHIPFNLRGKIATQRYSIPGLPSLYISNSIYAAWEEMRRPDFNEIQAIRLSNTRQLNLLDLRTDIYKRNGNLTDSGPNQQQLLNAVMIWPLLAACSVKVKNTNDTFKPEYILPQLLLQWVNKHLVDGILYSSTHIDMVKNRHEGSFFNIVLPVKSFHLEAGYCDHLTGLFESTNVLPMQLRQFTSASDRFYDQETISATVNPHIRAIELIEGSVQPYHATYFGILEYSLNYLELHPIRQ